MLLVSSDGVPTVFKARPGKSLLLVDDDPECARFIGHAANECGYDAVITISPHSFKAQYRSAEPDVVLIDLAMPGGDGIELLRFLAEEKCRATVIIVSGFDRRVLDAATRLGAVLGLRMGGALTKPICLGDLSDALAGLKRPDVALGPLDGVAGRDGRPLPLPEMPAFAGTTASASPLRRLAPSGAACASAEPCSET